MRNTKFFAFIPIAVVACLAGTGCSRLPRLDPEDMLRVATEKAGIAREAVEAAGASRVDGKGGVSVLEFRLKGMSRPVVFAVRFTHHKYRGWEFDSLRDRYGDWVNPKLFAEDVKAFHYSDTEYLVMLASMALSAYAVENEGLPQGEEILGEDVHAHYVRYRGMYEKFFWFAPPASMPAADGWGNPIAYTMDVPDYSVLPFLFEVRSPGEDAQFGNQDDIFVRRDGAQAAGVYAWKLWFLR